VAYLPIRKHPNIKSSFGKVTFPFILLGFFFFPLFSFAFTISTNTNLTISATVLSNGQNGNGNNNNNNNNSSGGGSSTPVPPTDITFSGIAYPNAKVFLLLNATEVLDTRADPKANFSLKLSSVTPGLKIFSLVAEDTQGTRSILITLPITVEDKTSTTVADLFIPPTLTTDENSYGRGEDVLIRGYAYPLSLVSLNMDSEANQSANAQNSGEYNFDLKTDALTVGEHDLQAKAEDDSNSKARVSGLGKIVPFFVTLNDKKKIKDSSNLSLVEDINGDGVIDIKDFSILAFWYGKSDVPKNVDFTGQGKVDLTDFSILAYYWNG